MPKPAFRTLIGLIAGLTAGIVVAAIPSAALHAIAAALEPIGTVWVNAIRMTVIPLVVSLLIATIAEENDLGAVGTLGVRAMAIFAALLTMLALVTFAVAPPLFSLLRIDATSAASLRGANAVAATPALPSFANWVTGLIPANPISAAVDGAMLPVIVFAVAFAAALARVEPPRRAAATALFRGVADAMLVVVGWVLAAAPIGVFCLAVALGVHAGVGVAGAVAFYLAVHCGLAIAATVGMYLVVRLFSDVPLAAFARAAIPAQVVAASTRSSVAALPAMIEGATRVLRLPLQIPGFALPFGVAVFRLNQGVTWIVSALFIAKLYGIPISTAQLALLGACSVPMSFSVPGIPSGGLFVSAPFFVAVGLPMEGVGILLALDAIPDVFKTLLNVTGQMAATALLARGESLADDGVRI